MARTWKNKNRYILLNFLGGSFFSAYRILGLDGAWSRWDIEGTHDYDSRKGFYDILPLLLDTRLHCMISKINWIDRQMRMYP